MPYDASETGSPSVRGPAEPRTLAYGRWMDVAAEEYARIVEMLGRLDDEQWRLPTDCEGWVVRDLVSHLTGAAAGTASVPELVRQARHARRLGHDGDLVDRINRVQVEERRSLSPRQLVADLEAAGRRGVRARRRIPSLLRSVPLPFGPPLGTRPIGYLMGRIYSRDAWMHRVDLARATGAELLLTPQHDGALVEDVVAEWATTHAEPYELVLTGPAGGRWTRGEGAEPVTIDAVEFARVMSGRAAEDGLLRHRVPF